MKKLMVLVVAVMVFLLTAGTAMAADTQTVAVTASVTGVCQFLTGGSMSFTLDPSAGGAVGGTVTQPTFWCTRGTAYTITDDDGLYEIGANANRLRHGVTITEFMPYTLTYTAAGTGAGRNSAITMDIAGQVAAVDYLDALAGNYGDTVTLTVNP